MQRSSLRNYIQPTRHACAFVIHRLHIHRNRTSLHRSFIKPRLPIPRADPETTTRLDNNSDDDELLEIDIPDPQHLHITDTFSPSLVTKLRSHFDLRFQNPLSSSSDRFIWDYWYVPNQYKLLRTPAEAFFPPHLYDDLVDQLTAFGESVLGCRGLSPIWLSYYIDGCKQELHTDAPHGPWAFVLSLTTTCPATATPRPDSNHDSNSNSNQRNPKYLLQGGETFLLNPEVVLGNYWAQLNPSTGLETPQLTIHVKPELGRLTVFDGRIPHGVNQVRGADDPLDARVVLHGWFTPPTPFYSWTSTGLEGDKEKEREEAESERITPMLNQLLDAIYGQLEGEQQGGGCVGTVVVRVKVNTATGRTEDVQFLTNTLVARSSEGCDDRIGVIGTILDHLFAAAWGSDSRSASSSLVGQEEGLIMMEITIPFTFQ